MLDADCGGHASMLFYMSEEGQESRNAFNGKRKPDFNKYSYDPSNNILSHISSQ